MVESHPSDLYFFKVFLTSSKIIIIKVRREEEMENYILFNEFSIHNQKPGKSFFTMMEAIPTLKYWSNEAIKELAVGLSEMVLELEELCSDRKQKAQFGVFRRRMKRFFEFVPEDRDLLLKKFYGLMLSCDGVGLLSGFGLSNSFGDRLVGNPEYQSIYER